MTDIKRVSFIAVLFLVALRLSIGWQMLYEGLWKYDTLDSANPWTARGYLVNAEGPYRDYFRSMVGDFPQGNDPDDLLWLDEQTVSDAWTDWRQRFVGHYGLNESQQQELKELLDGAESWSLPEKELPARVKEGLDGLASAHAQLAKQNKPDNLPLISYEGGKLIVDGSTPLTPDEFKKLYGWVNAVLTERVENGQLKSTLAVANSDGTPQLDEQGQPVRMEDGVDKNFAVAVVKLAQQIESGLSYRRRLRATLKGDPTRAGVHVVGKSIDWQMGPPAGDASAGTELLTYGDIQKYQDELAQYEQMRQRATMPHEFDHLDRLKTKLAGLRSKAVGPVKALDAELKEKAQKLLTPEQLAIGQMPRLATPLVKASDQAMWGLIIIGTLLLAGLATRIAAIAGAVMLFMFYIVLPPWPGVPEAPGPEHSYIVNKNLIEIIALVAIAAMPTGTWFGLDGVIRWLFGSRKAA
ncbi:MAG: DoxX family protein [Planctomycetaceae bacterium]